MDFVKVVFTPEALGVAGVATNITSGFYGRHQLIRRLWPTEGQSPLWHWDESARQPTVFVLADRPVTPEGIPGVKVSVKPWDPQLQAGERIIFRLHANPTKRLFESRKRIDVMTHAWQEKLYDGANRYDSDRQAVFEWCTRKFSSTGLTINTINTCHVQQQTQRKKGGIITLMTATIEGYATINDPDQAIPAIAQGFGTAKGFGCGLFLMKRT